MWRYRSHAQRHYQQLNSERLRSAADLGIPTRDDQRAGTTTQAIGTGTKEITFYNRVVTGDIKFATEDDPPQRTIVRRNCDRIRQNNLQLCIQALIDQLAIGLRTGLRVPIDKESIGNYNRTMNDMWTVTGNREGNHLWTRGSVGSHDRLLPGAVDAIADPIAQLIDGVDDQRARAVQRDGQRDRHYCHPACSCAKRPQTALVRGQPHPDTLGYWRYKDDLKLRPIEGPLMEPLTIYVNAITILIIPDQVIRKWAGNPRQRLPDRIGHLTGQS